jgi:all-trans-retinol dehydrogenase (NAD+)
MSSNRTTDCATKVGALAFHEGLTAELRGAMQCPEVKATIVHPTWADTAILSGNKERLAKAGQKVIDPQIVSDAVVKQILSCRGGQLIISEGGTLISTLRSWPAWLKRLALRAFDAADALDGADALGVPTKD